MHHKRKRSSTRTEIKRMDNKSYRAAVARSIENGTVKGNPRTDRWSYRPEPLPIIDGICNGSSHSKKARPKKSKPTKPKCRHEWYHETAVEDHFYLICTKPVCDNSHARWARDPWSYHACNGCWDHKSYSYGDDTWTIKTKHWSEKVWYKITKEQATCINCWEVRVYNVDDPTDSRHAWRGRYTRLKHRTQDPYSGMTVRVN